MRVSRKLKEFADYSRTFAAGWNYQANTNTRKLTAKEQASSDFILGIHMCIAVWPYTDRIPFNQPGTKRLHLKTNCGAS